MPDPIFSPADIRLIRAQALAGALDVRAWADARNCGLETIRRIARRDTYRHISEHEEAELLSDEPSEASLAASLASLTLAASALPPQRAEVNSILDDLTRKGGTK